MDAVAAKIRFVPALVSDFRRHLFERPAHLVQSSRKASDTIDVDLLCASEGEGVEVSERGTDLVRQLYELSGVPWIFRDAILGRALGQLVETVQLLRSHHRNAGRDVRQARIPIRQLPDHGQLIKQK